MDSNYYGARNQILITKAVNAVDPMHPTAYEDANSAPGPILLRFAATSKTARPPRS